MDTSASLLESLQNPDESESWALLNQLYGPLIRKWLSRNEVWIAEHDDIAQEVLVQVAGKINEFEHSGRTGAFRGWLKQITINCLRNYQRKQANRQQPVGGSDFERFINEWEVPRSRLSQAWHEEYQQSVMAYLLQVARKKFSDKTYRAFYETAILNRDAESVSQELNMSVPAIYTARSRVLKELRQLKKGICDDDSSIAD